MAITSSGMDAALLSTFSALAGTAIGAVSSLATTFLSTQAQVRATHLATERAKREDVYGRYMDELARLYANALENVGVDYGRLTAAYALNGRIALYSTAPVVEAAERAMRYIIDIALGPVRAPEEMRTMMDTREADVIGAFAQACRAELYAIR